MKPSKSDVSTIAAVAQLLAAVLIVAALFFARDVFIPLALGLLLSFLLGPLRHRRKPFTPTEILLLWQPF